MSIPQDVIAELLKNYKSSEELLSKNGLPKQLQKAVIEKALQAEMAHHLGYMKHDPKDKKELLGLWIEKNEGAKFWLGVITELKNRGVQNIFIACVDGLKGFPEAINTAFPKTEVQLCIVHMVRNGTRNTR